jgi:hypothetical protein
MSYSYKVAPGYRRRATIDNSPFSPFSTHSVPSPLIAKDNSGTTHERRHAAQTPTIHNSPTISIKEVRFDSPDPSSGSYYPGDRPRKERSPSSQGSLFMSSPLAPSLSYSPSVVEDPLCPPTPLLSPRPLAPVNEPSLFDSNFYIYAAYAEIGQVLCELKSCVRSSSFLCPTDLEFEPAPLNSLSVPKLTRSVKNGPLIEQVDKLMALQRRLDGISSHGDKELRMTRKTASVKVEQALKDLKRIQAAVWSRVSNIDSFKL